MNLKVYALALLAGSTLAFGSAHAQAGAITSASMTSGRNLTADDLEALRTELRSSKKQITAETLQLTADEATKFWPVYDQYAAELSDLKDARYTLIAEYVNTFGKYTDATAANFISRWLQADLDEDRLRAAYLPQVAKVLPGIKSATFFQIDRRLNMAISLQVASQLPILQLQADRPR